MEDGKVKIAELNKVIDHLGTLTKKDLIGKMMETPARKMERLKTAVTRMYMVLNNTGAIELMVSGIEKITDVVVILGKAIKPVITSIGTFFKNITEYLGMFGDIIYRIFFKTWPQVLASFAAFFFFLQSFPPAMLAVTKALSFLWRMFLVPAAVISSILLVEDLIGALMGKDSVIADMAKEDGILGTLSATILSFGQALATIGQLITSIFIERDWQLAGEYIKEFFQNIQDNFPNATQWVKDMWDGFTIALTDMMSRAKLFGSALKLSLNPFASEADAAQAWSKFQTYDVANMRYDQAAATQAPALLARQNPNTVTNPTVNATITINGSSYSPEQIAQAVSDQLDSHLNMASANYSNLVMRR